MVNVVKKCCCSFTEMSAKSGGWSCVEWSIISKLLIRQNTADTRQSPLYWDDCNGTPNSDWCDTSHKETLTGSCLRSVFYYSGPLSIWLLLAACKIHGKNGQKLEWRAKNGRNSSTAGHGANYEKFKWESGSRLAILAILLGVDTTTSHWFVSTRVFCTSGGYSEFWQWRKKTELIKNCPWSQESIWFVGQIGHPFNPFAAVGLYTDR